MRKFAVLFLVLSLVLVLGAWAVAQPQPEPNAIELPRNEFAITYAYEHASLSGSLAPTNGNVTQDSTGMQGFDLQFTHYLPQVLGGNLGLTVDLARVSNAMVDPTGIQYVRWSFLGGPSYRLGSYGFFSPSVHVLGGVDHGTFTVPSGATTFQFRDTDFAIAGGGSVDGNLSRHIGIRLAQFDYFYTHHYGSNQSSFRYLGGVVLRF